MEGFRKSFWRMHKFKLVVASLIGIAYVIFLMNMPASNRGYLLGIPVVQAVLCSPFTYRTAVGRLWWASYVTAIAMGVIAVLLGMHNPLSWICALIAGCAFAIGVCLRWNYASA